MQYRKYGACNVTQQLHFRKAKYLGLTKPKRAHEICTHLQKVIKMRKANLYAGSPNLQGRALQFSHYFCQTTFCTHPAKAKFKQLLSCFCKSFKVTTSQ
jgi:hypothetical protein